MRVASLSFRTELELLLLGGSLVEDRGSFLVVRTPTNPTFHWGNFLLIDTPPGEHQLTGWLATFRQEFPEALHVTLGVDRPEAGDLSPLRKAGYRVDLVAAMTASEVHPPARPNAEAELRPLASDADWAQQVDLSLAGEEDDPHLTRDFLERRHHDYRELVEAGHGRWWAAFLDDQLVSSLGIYSLRDGLARFQNVKTHPDHRGRGLAGTLVHFSSRDALDTLGAHTLVMAADPDYLAIRIYRSVGFVDGGRHAEATLMPAHPPG